MFQAQVVDQADLDGQEDVLVEVVFENVDLEKGAEHQREILTYGGRADAVEEEAEDDGVDL